jgi:hypothetical protein
VRVGDGEIIAGSAPLRGAVFSSPRNAWGGVREAAGGVML